MAEAQAVKSAIRMSHLSVRKQHSGTVAGALPVRVRGNPCVVTWGSGAAGLCLWQCNASGHMHLQHAASRSLNGVAVEHAAVSTEGTLVVLTADATMSIWLLPELILVSRGPTGFKQFELFDCAVDDGSIDDGDTETRVLAVVESDDGHTVLKILSLSGFVERYELEVSRATIIANVCDPENLCIAEGRSDADGTRYQLRCLSPTLPTNRFYHLLHKHRFDEAMQLAQLFGLDMEMVHRVQVTSLLDAADKDPSRPDLLAKLRQSLEFVADNEVVVDSCLQASLPDAHQTMQILRFGLSRLQDGPDTPETMVLKTKIFSAVKRLASYCLNSPAEFVAADWHGFRTVDLCRELISCLATGRFAAAEVIWERHGGEYDLASEINTILSSIPEHFPLPPECIKWFASRVFLDTMPQDHAFILDWCNSRCRSLELCQRDSWPENALSLIEACDCILRIHGHGIMDSNASHALTPAGELDCICGRSDDDVDGNASYTPEDVNDCIADLLQLKTQLEDIVFLRDHLHVTISLSKYTAESPVSILAQQLELVVAPELVAGAIKDQAEPYLLRHRLSTDTFLLQYLTEFMGTGVGTSVSGSAWESKAIAIVNHIGDTSKRSNACLEFMRRVAVPLSSEADQLIQRALHESQSYSTAVREQFRIIELRTMLQTYGISHYNFSDLSLARGLLMHIVKRDDIATSMNDALRLVGAYHHLTRHEAFVARLQHLTETDLDPKLSETTLSMVPTEDILRVCTEYCLWADDIICEGESIMGDDDIILRAAQIALQCVESMRCSASLTPNDSERVRRAAQKYRGFVAIKQEFDMFVPISALETEEFALEQVWQELMSLTSAIPTDSVIAADDPVYFKLCRLIDLLGVPRKAVAINLAHRTTKLGPVSTDKCAAVAMLFCMEYCKSGATFGNGETLYSVASAIMQRAKNDSGDHRFFYVSDIINLAQKAVVLCPVSKLLQYLRFAKSCEILHSIHRQCENGDYGQAIRSMSGEENKTSSQTTLISTSFKESGLVLSSDIAMPVAVGFAELAANQSSGSGDAATITATSKCAADLIKYLTDNGLSQLALYVSVYAFGICAQHKLLGDMDDARVKGVLKAVLPRAMTVICDISQSLFSKVLCHPTIDRKLAVGYVTMLNVQAGFSRYRKALALTKKNYDRLAELAFIGTGFAKLWMQDSFLQECSNMHKRAKWWSKLASIDVSFDRKAFEADPATYALSLIPRVVKKTNGDFKYVSGFAFDHGVGKTDLVEALVPILLEMSQDATADAEVAYQEKIMKALRHVGDASRLLEILDEKHRVLVGPYNYARLRFLFKVVIALEGDAATSDENRTWARNGLMLLEVLWHYKRRSPPSDYEVAFLVDDLHLPEEVISAGSDLATERLPFHVLAYGDALSVITPELCLDSARCLAPLARLLPGGLKPDDFLVTLIQQLFSESLEKLPSLEHLEPIYDKIEDDETALMASKMIADYYPVGESKVAALSLGVKRASTWLENCPKDGSNQVNVERILHRMTAVRNTAENNYLIQKHNFNDELCVGKLLETPEPLIRHLYSTNLILAGADSVRLQQLHLVVDNIGNRYGIDCDSIRRAMVQEWLINGERTQMVKANKVSSGGSLSLAGILDDDHDTPTNELGRETNRFGFDSNLNRAAILMRYNSDDASLQQLAQVAFRESAKVSTDTRQRALLLLCSVFPSERIAVVLGCDITAVREHMLALHYVRRLAELDIHMSTSEFASASKDGMVKSVWREHRHNDHAVSLVADMCMDYDLHDGTLWSSTLQAMMDLQMWSDLRRLISAISGVPELWLLPSMPEVWKRTLDASLSQLKESESQNDVEKFAKLLLQSPFLLDEYYIGAASATLRLVPEGSATNSGTFARLRTFVSSFKN